MYDYSRILESLKSKIDNFEIKEFMKINKNLRNFEKQQITTDIPKSVETTEKILSVMVNEVGRNIDKQILTKLFDTTKFEFLDFRKSSGLNESKLNIKKLYELIMSCKEDYTNIITNGLIVSELQGLRQFFQATTSSNNSLYKVGKLYDINIWVDPHMEYNDYRVLLFKSIEFNVEDVITEVIQCTSSDRLLVEHKLDISVGDSKLIFIINGETSKGFSQFKSLQRDLKIDKILEN